MEIALIILAVIVFAINYFMTLRYGSDSPLWLILSLVVVFGGGFFITEDTTIFYFSILPIFAYVSSRSIALVILRNGAGKRVLTYARSKGNIVWGLLYVVLYFYLAYQMSELMMDNLYNSVSLDNERLIKLETVNTILMTILGVSTLLNLFHKGEFFESGISDPDFQFFPWSGYKAYEWVEYKKKNEKRFLLFLEGARNVSLSIDDLSEQDKNTLEELLSAKLEKIPKSQK